MAGLILLSGGVDSAFVLSQHHEDIEHAVFFNYNQPPYREEKAAARSLAAFFNVGFSVVALPLVGGRAMGGKDAPSVVPVRNASMVAVAANLAAAAGLDAVYLGAILEDEADYPDCRPEYLEHLNNITTPFGVEVRGPVVNTSKREILAAIPDAVLQLAWSCYNPVRPFVECGVCNSCLGRNLV